MTARPDDRRHRQHLAAGPPAGSLDLYAALGPRPGHGAAAAALPQTGQPSPGAPQHAPRTPAPCPSRVETLRSPTCRTPGHLRCTRFGRSYARGHALRHQPAGPPRLLRPPRWLACWASEHAESGRTRTSLSLPPPPRRCQLRREAHEARSAGHYDSYQLAPAHHGAEPDGARGKPADGRVGMGCFLARI